MKRTASMYIPTSKSSEQGTGTKPRLSFETMENPHTGLGSNCCQFAVSHRFHRKNSSFNGKQMCFKKSSWKKISNSNCSTALNESKEESECGYEGGPKIDFLGMSQKDARTLPVPTAGMRKVVSLKVIQGYQHEEEQTDASVEQFPYRPNELLPKYIPMADVLIYKGAPTTNTALIKRRLMNKIKSMGEY